MAETFCPITLTCIHFQDLMRNDIVFNNIVSIIKFKNCFQNLQIPNDIKAEKNNNFVFDIYKFSSHKKI